MQEVEQLLKLLDYADEDELLMLTSWFRYSDKGHACTATEMIEMLGNYRLKQISAFK